MTGSSVFSDRDRHSAAGLLVRCLENEGVRVVFGLPGEENIHLTFALARSGIRYILTRHEQAASFMAEMYGRVTGAAGVVSATLGPGAINLQLGVADAMTNSTPLVALSAQVGHNRNYKEAHQFVDLVNMFAPITKWSASVPSARAIPEMLRRAFKTAETERPGAVYLAVPEDVDAAPAAAELQPLPRYVVRAEAPSPGQIARAAALLHNARHPIVLAGHGAARNAAAHRSPLSPAPSDCRWQPPSMARESLPTTSSTPWARSASCAATTPTSVSTRPT